MKKRLKKRAPKRRSKMKWQRHWARLVSAAVMIFALTAIAYIFHHHYYQAEQKTFVPGHIMTESAELT